MNNLSSYCGLVDAKIRASDKDLLVPNAKKNIVYALYFQSVSFILFSFQFSGQSFVSVADGIRIL